MPRVHRLVDDVSAGHLLLLLLHHPTSARRSISRIVNNHRNRRLLTQNRGFIRREQRGYRVCREGTERSYRGSFRCCARASQLLCSTSCVGISRGDEVGRRVNPCSRGLRRIFLRFIVRPAREEPTDGAAHGAATEKSWGHLGRKIFAEIFFSKKSRENFPSIYSSILQSTEIGNSNT
jgi:hypothetical protein